MSHYAAQVLPLMKTVLWKRVSSRASRTSVKSLFSSPCKMSSPTMSPWMKQCLLPTTVSFNHQASNTMGRSMWWKRNSVFVSQQWGSGLKQWNVVKVETLTLYTNNFNLRALVNLTVETENINKVIKDAEKKNHRF